MQHININLEIKFYKGKIGLKTVYAVTHTFGFRIKGVTIPYEKSWNCVVFKVVWIDFDVYFDSFDIHFRSRGNEKIDSNRLNNSEAKLIDIMKNQGYKKSFYQANLNCLIFFQSIYINFHIYFCVYI